MAKEFIFKGLKTEEIQKLSLKEFAELIPSRERRSLLRGFNDSQKILLKNLKGKSTVKTHCRSMVIIPEMIGKTIKVHNGKEFSEVRVVAEMLGHRLGEFALTRKVVTHNAPGVGATRSSAALSVR